jgi:hypothetical protein
MIVRARHLFFAWLAYGALQFALLGVGGAAVQAGVGSRGARSQAETQSLELGKRVLASELGDRRAPSTPFAPSGHIRLDLPTVFGSEAPLAPPRPISTAEPRTLPPARAPPALS